MRGNACVSRASTEEVEDREQETAAGRQVLRRAGDDAIEQRPAIGTAVVRGRLRILAVGAGRRRHLRRVAADDVEALTGHRRVAVAESRVDDHAVERGIRAHGGHRLGHDVGRHDGGARFRGEHGGQPEPRAELEHALARTYAQVPAKEARARLGRLHAVGDAKQAVAPGVEEDALVHYLPCTRRK